MPDLTALALASRIPTTVTASAWATVRATVTGGLQFAAISTDGTRYYASHGTSNGSTGSSQMLVVAADGSSTTASTSSSTGRWLARAAWLNGKHYVYGGVLPSVTGALESYTPGGTDGASGTWATLTTGPVMTSHDVVALGGFLYSIGGTTTNAGPGATGTLSRYDPTANTWATLTAMPVQRFNGSAVAAGGRIYYLGGGDTGSNGTTTVQIYDVSAGTWSTGAALPGPVSGPGGAVVVGSKIYVLSTTTSTVYVYDVTAGTWTTQTQFGTALNIHNYGATFAVGNVITGFSGTTTTQSMERLDLTGYLDALVPAGATLSPFARRLRNLQQYLFAAGLPVAATAARRIPTTPPVAGWATIAATESRYAMAASTDGTVIYSTHGFRINSNAATSIGYTITPSGVVTAMPAATAVRYSVGGAWCNGKHYAIGGANTSNAAVTAVEAYTPAGTNGASGTWTSLAGLPAVLLAMGVAVIGSFVYVAGGSTAVSASGVQSAVYRYDTVGNTWVTLAAMPAARYYGAMIAVGTKLYYLGGTDSTGNPVTSVYVYDTVAATWSTGTPLTFATSGTPAVAVGTVIYLVTGTGYYRYDTVTGSTSAIVAAAFPTSHGDLTTAAPLLGGAIYVVSGNLTGNVDRLDVTSGPAYTAAVRATRSLTAAGV